jgi:hypothetical protein
MNSQWIDRLIYVCILYACCVVMTVGAAESLRDMYVPTSRASIVPPQMANNLSGNLFSSGPPTPSYQTGRYSSLGLGR